MSSRAKEDHLYWQKHIKTFKASGLNKHQYCKRHEVSYHRFLYWLDKLTNEPLSAAPQAKEL